MDTARKTADAIIDRLLDRAAGYAVLSTSERDAAAEIVRAAFLAERLAQIEQDAKIAEHLNGWGADCGRGGHAEHIAKVIRSQTPYEKETK